MTKFQANILVYLKSQCRKHLEILIKSEVNDDQISSKYIGIFEISVQKASRNLREIVIKSEINDDQISSKS